MAFRTNELGQKVGLPVDGWRELSRPGRVVLEGDYCRLEPLDPVAHAGDLHKAYSEDRDGALWTYLPYGPFDSLEDFVGWLGDYCTDDDPLFYAVIEPESGGAAGVASYLRINPAMGTIEVGHINFAPRLQRTTAATECMFLMMKHAFELGYRRCEWKCDSLNDGSRRAALRLGFSYEELFRQDVVCKGRNRDTAWYSIIDSEWPLLKKAYTRWLAPDNFDTGGCQKTSLAEPTSPLLKQAGTSRQPR